MLGVFFCSANQLTSLVGAPLSVSEDFYCSANPLTSLKGLPQKFRKFFSDLGDFSSLEEIPEDLRLSPEERAHQQYLQYLRDTDAGLGLRRAIPLPKRIDWKKFKVD